MIMSHASVRLGTLTLYHRASDKMPNKVQETAGLSSESTELAIWKFRI